METLVVIALTSVVGVGLLGMIAYFYRSNAYLLEATSAVDSASRGVRESIRSLREATYAEDGSYPLAAVATSSATFYSDADDDAPVERIRLYLSDGVFYRGITEAAGNPPSYAGQPEQATVIASWVKNPDTVPVFQYFDEEGYPLTYPVDVAEVRAVYVRLDVDLNPARAPNIITLEGNATLRNVRSE